MATTRVTLRDRIWRDLTARTGPELPYPGPSGHVHAPGLNPDRILLFGDGFAAGAGAIDHDLAIPGHLARTLSSLTGRGSSVRVETDPVLSIPHAIDLARHMRLKRFDAVVVSIGASDATRLLGSTRWRACMHELMRVLRDRTSAMTPIIVLAVQPEALTRESVSPISWQGVHRAQKLNAITAAVVAEYEKVSFLSLKLPDASRGVYAALARGIAEHVAPLIEVDTADPGSAGWVRRQAQDEDERQASLDAMGVVDSSPDPGIDRVVALARSIFSTEFAAVELIDGNRSWLKSVAGVNIREVPREDSFCAHTIRSAEPLVVGDATKDERFKNLSGVIAGLRFYAGYPIESPDGSRIGALCVSGTTVRDPSRVDLTALRDLALVIQRRLQELSAGSQGLGGSAQFLGSATGRSD